MGLNLIFLNLKNKFSTFYLVIAASALIISCSEKKKAGPRMFSDLASENMKGEVIANQDSVFLVDTTGKFIFSSSSTREIKDGNQIKKISIDANNKKTDNTYEHYDNGLYKKIITEQNGKTIHRAEIQLDSAGRMTSAQTFDSTGKMDYYNTDLKTDDLGNITSGRLFKADSSLINTFTVEYDKYTIIRDIHTDSIGKVTTLTFENRMNEHGDPVIRTVITTVKDSITKKTTKFSYQYDQSGNWIEKTIMSEAGRPNKIIRRVVTYAAKAN